MDRQRQWGLRWRVAAGSLTLAALGVVLVPGVSAASPTGAHFVYELCDSALPGGNPPVASFVVNPGVPFTPFQTCAQPGGSIGITETGATAAAYGYWGIAIPATSGGYVESITTSGSSSGLGPGNDHTYAYEPGWPPNGAGESKRVFQNSEGEEPFYFSEPGIRMLMNCDGNVPGGCGAGPTIAIHDIAADEVDPNPPTLSGLRGSLLAPGATLRGHQTLAVDAADVGGGVSDVAVLVNGLPGAAAKTGACSLAAVNNGSYVGTVALSTSPCPASLAGEWLLNTESYPFHDGANTVQVCASDLATSGLPNTSCLPAAAVDVDNSCNASPVAGGELLSAQFSQSERETQTVGFGQEADVVGQLQTNAGDPVAGATLCVKVATIGVNAPLADIGTVQTDAGGHYSYTVPPGPNREVLIGYRHDTAQVARDVRYYAHAKPTLWATPGKLRNGERVRLQGRLPEPRAAERVVVLQAQVPGSHRWITFRKATTGHRGRFRANYHFTSTTRKTEYRFRAVVPRQSGYPWDQGASKPTPVTVTPAGHHHH
jgi:hypothetical protein